MREALAQLGQALEKCRSTPAWTLASAALESCVDELFRLRTQFDALSLALIREADAQAVAARLGAPSTAAWLRDSQRISIQAAGALVKLAARVDANLPATGAALAAGEVNLEQVGVIAKAVADLPAEHRPTGEQFLLAQATQFGPRDLGVLSRHLFEVVAPDEAAQREADQLERAERQAYEKSVPPPSTTDPRSAPPKPAASPARPASSRSYSAGRGRCSTSAGNDACSPGRCAAPSSPGIADAPSRDATDQLAGATATIFGTGSMEDRRH